MLTTDPMAESLASFRQTPLPPRPAGAKSDEVLGIIRHALAHRPDLTRYADH